ncbi:MAG: hypothetical protein JJ921_13910 [Pseudomonadales bacterium]|nr:hypothetical protein [Pseudomonadales bacterium]MBO7004535.1 hypothetical protein [Pseudomonadales bacterium]
MSVPILRELDNRFLPYKDGVPSAYGWTLFLGFLVFLATQSIQYSDTDLWYHIHGGRYLFEQGTFYNPLVDSFLDAEERDSVVYFWGFQALVYLVWSQTGEFGLVLLKAIGLFLAGFFAMKVVLQNRPLNDATFLQLVVITAVVGMLAARGFSLRPHVVSYIMIPVFTYILGNREKAYPVLPVLTVLWVNLHGVEYVVGALICGAFFLARLVNWLEEGRPQQGVMSMVWIASCAPAMLINPFGVHLITTPFLHSPDLHLFIGELRKYELELIFDFEDGLSFNATLLTLMGLAAYAALVCLGNARKHIAALILAAGALILLLRAQRFVWEWVFLTLPLISAALSQEKSIKHNLLTSMTLALMLVGLTKLFWPNVIQGLNYYPYDENSLPNGTTEFIRSQGITGRYAIEPSYAGYVEFMLSPDVKVHMDMQFPPFTSHDFHPIAAAMVSAAGFRSYVERFKPDMFGARRKDRTFPDTVAKEMGYLPVFFDREVVLFLGTHSYPDLARRFELTAVDPFDPRKFKADEIGKAIQELQRMRQIIDVPEIKQTLLNLLVTVGDLTAARVLRDELLIEDPHHPSTLFLSARLDHLSGNCAAAVPNYQKSIAATDDDVKPLRSLLAECLFVLKDLAAAYEQFGLAMNPYGDTNPDKLQYYQYALTAIGVGKNDKAKRLLAMLETIDPEGEYAERIESVRTALD